MNKRNLFIICIVVAVIVVAYTALVKTQFKFRRLEEEISSAQLRLGKFISLLVQRDKLESEYNKDIALLSNIKDSNDFINRIQKNAEKVGLSIQNIRPVQSKDEGIYKVYSVEVEAQDEVITLARFMHTFSEDLKAVSVENLKIYTQNTNFPTKIRLLLSTIADKEYK